MSRTRIIPSIFGLLLALFAFSPFGNTASAAAQCPPGLKADVGLGILNATCNAVNSDGSLGAVVGKSFDPAAYGAIPANCAAGTYPMWLPSQGTASEPPACVDANGQSAGVNGAGDSLTPQGPELKECQKANIYSADGIYYGVRCAGNSIIIALSAATVGISTSLLDLSSYLLNVSLDKTVVHFGTLYDSISSYVGQIWTMFRDLANILLIGLFVFIAISIILGLEQFGQKKLIARVIIIAILINFSFLFTLIAINSSNALASYIYNNTMTSVVQSTDNNAAGVADVFKKLLKTSSVKETTDAMVDMNNADNGGLSTVLLHTVFAVIFQLAAALVFLYGSLLLAARFVILIVLLVISAAAFATYLSPSMASGDYGWSAWWNQLLRNSFFAPLMMIFLFSALKISTGIANGSGSLGALSKVGGVADPTAVATVLNYIFILGFLWLGIYISSHVAGGAANRLASSSLANSIGAGAGIGAFAGRWTIGRSMDKRATRLGGDAKELAQIIRDKKNAGDMSWKDDQSKLAKIMRQKSMATSMSKMTYDARNTGLGGLLKKSGAADALAQGTKKNYGDTAHAEAEKAAKDAVSLAMGEKAARSAAEQAHKGDREGAAADHDRAQEEIKNQREAIRTERNKAEDELRERKKEIEAAELEHRNAQGQLQGATPEERRALLTKMDEQTEKIKSAQAASRPLETQVRSFDTNLKDLEYKSRDVRETLRKNLREVAQKERETTKKILAEDASMIQEVATANLGGNSFSGLLGRATGIRDSNKVHHTEVIVASRLKFKDKADEKKGVDEYLAKPHDDSHKTATGGDAHAHAA